MPSNAHLPKTYGMVLFPGFQALDVFGVLDILNTLSSFHHTLDLCLISSTLSPVSTAPVCPIGATSVFKSPNFHQSLLPTHTFADCPPVDVLVVPGGNGARADLAEVRDFVRGRFPHVQYFMTICTGAAIAAQAGVLDGFAATSNKSAWKWVTAQSAAVHWVPRARWTVDGKVWTSSGVAAGLDAIFAFVEEVYGPAAAGHIQGLLEYDRHMDPNWDPWSEKYGCKWPLEEEGADEGGEAGVGGKVKGVVNK